jgi:hypothetical protein
VRPSLKEPTDLDVQPCVHGQQLDRVAPFGDPHIRYQGAVSGEDRTPAEIEQGTVHRWLDESFRHGTVITAAGIGASVGHRIYHR